MTGRQIPLGTRSMTMAFPFPNTQEIYSRKYYDQLLETIQTNKNSPDIQESAVQVQKVKQSQKRHRRHRGSRFHNISRETTKSMDKNVETESKPKLQLSHGDKYLPEHNLHVKLQDIISVKPPEFTVISTAVPDDGNKIKTQTRNSESFLHFPPISAGKQTTFKSDSTSPSSRYQEYVIENSRNSRLSLIKGISQSLESLPSRLSPGSPRKKTRYAKTKSDSEPIISPKEIEYKNKNKELTRKLHLKSNQAGFHERPRIKGTPTKQFQTPSISVRPGEEPLSIRKKIEQFKRWHEDQYKEKLEKLKLESEQVDILAVGIKSASTNLTNHDNNNKSVTQREVSAKTWRTWRNVNDSYAYRDVKKYIIENELMTEEKEKWIKEWIYNVDVSSPAPAIPDSQLTEASSKVSSLDRNSLDAE